jgi:ADP-ribosylglycohydrolase/extradiol dioxygenase family protein
MASQLINQRLHEATQGAILAFAVGDALGWPLEVRGNRVGGATDLAPALAFHEWTRREGGRWAPHEERIPPGTYSDDTQLTLAVARSLEHPNWWAHLVEVELPWWAHYELGGGGASKRAAQSWGKGRPPWDPSGAKGYWTAGGNGAAMRVLAHCVRPNESFSAVRARVLADGAATHGDPLALVGAQLYAYALWVTLRRRDSLGWGELLDDVLAGIGEWADLDPMVVPAGWHDHLAPEYFDRWGRTVDDTVHLLRQARDELAHGALAVDDRVLAGLGCMSSSGGAGTITAAGALYLASRHASNPQHGLVRAAFARGADTDTLAAMTGGLLGALHGPAWLGPAADHVLDANLLRHVLTDNGPRDPEFDEPYSRPAQRYVDDWLAGAYPGSNDVLPFYGPVEMLDIRDLDNRASHIRSWWLRNSAGQTFRIKRTSRSDRAPWVELAKPLREKSAVSQPTAREVRVRGGLVVRVTDLTRAREFYESILGLAVTRETRTSVVLNGWLALEPDASPSSDSAWTDAAARDARFAVTLFVDERDFDAIRERLRWNDAATEIKRADRGPRLRTTDPDGTPVEVRLAASSEVLAEQLSTSERPDARPQLVPPGEHEGAWWASTDNWLAGTLVNAGPASIEITGVALDLPNGGRVHGRYRAEPPGQVDGGFVSTLQLQGGQALRAEFETSDGSLGDGLAGDVRPRLQIAARSDELGWRGVQTLELLRRPASVRGELHWHVRTID